MATHNLTDIRKLRFLPIKQVSLKSHAGDIYLFSEVLAGASCSFDPITSKDDRGVDITAAYLLTLDFAISRNDFQTLATHINTLIADNSLKGVAIWFNRYMNINSNADGGEMLIYANYSDEAVFNLWTKANVTYNYEEDKPVVKFNVTSLMTVNQVTNLWSQSMWNTYSWT